MHYSIKNKKEEKSELILEIEVQNDFVEKFKEKATKALGKNLEIKGFRKGMAPTSVIEEKVGSDAILNEQAYQALYEIIPQVVLDEKIDALTNPKIEITKVGVGSNLEFKATFTLMPNVELPDYKSIAKSIPEAKEVKVDEKELNEYIEYLRKSRAEADFMKKKTNGEPTSAKASPGKEVDEKEKENLPEVNDEFVKTLGNFKDVADFKKQLSENMKKDKEAKEIQSRRIKIIEKIISETKTDLPEILVDEELNRMREQFKSDVEKVGIKFEDYLKEIKKTEEEMKKEWQADAIKRAKMNLILPKIAKEEKITPDSKKVDHEVKHLLEHHKDLGEAQAKAYVVHVLSNEEVFKFLEEIK